MTKQEKIQEAYGDYWQESKSFINENGWMNAKEWIGGIGNTQIHSKLKGIELECMDNHDPKYCYWFRPKSLQGIEDNNGWILIENEADLPAEKEFFKFIPRGLFNNEFIGWIDKELGEVFFIDFSYYGIEFDGSVYSSKVNGWLTSQITHYQPIIKSKEPIY